MINQQSITDNNSYILDNILDNIFNILLTDVMPDLI